MRMIALVAGTVLVITTATSATGSDWRVKTGHDSHSGVPYAIAMLQSDDGTGVLGIECQKEQDIMVGLTVPGFSGALQSTIGSFAVIGAGAITAPLAVEPGSDGDIFVARISEEPKTSKLLVYLLSNHGRLKISIVGVGSFQFGDNGREQRILSVLKACGIDVASRP